MKEIVLCEKCKAEAFIEIKGNCLSIKCPKCGWNIASTYYSLEELDENLYSLSLNKDNNSSLENIKLVAHLTNCNFVQVKKCFENESVLITEKALKIHEISDRLKESNISFKIEPDFPY